MKRFKLLQLLVLLAPMLVLGGGPAGLAEGEEQVPAWVNAGTHLFEEAKGLVDGLNPEEHSDKLVDRARAIVEDFAQHNASESQESIRSTTEKIDFLAAHKKFNVLAYSSMHFYLASLVSPQETDIQDIVSLSHGFCESWKDLDTFTETIKDTFSKIVAKYSLTGDVLESSMLPMYASSQDLGDLGVKPLLENTLKGHFPFILTPPGKTSVHGGIVQSPLEMISHDFVHALIIQSYLDRRRFFPRFTSVSDSLKSYDFLSIGRSFFDGFFGFNYIKEEALSNLSKLDLATEEGQRKLMKLFVAFHEFPTNDIFKTYDDFIEGKKAKIMRGSDFRDFFQKNIDHIARLYDQDEGALKQAYETLVGSKLEIYIKNQSLDDMMDFLKNHPLGFEITPEGLEALSTNNESACLLKCFDSDHVIVTRDDRPASQSKSRIKLVIYSKAMRADEVITNVTTISDSFFKKEFILKNFEDYGKILQMVGLIDPKLNPELLEGRQIVEGLRCLMDS